MALTNCKNVCGSRGTAPGTTWEPKRKGPDSETVLSWLTDGGTCRELTQAKEERSRSQKGMSAVGDHGSKIMGALFRG